MSTVYEPSVHSRRRLRRWRQDEDDAGPPRRLPIKSLLMLGLASLAVWFAPTVVANSPLLNMFVANATRDVRGSVDCRRASLGWLSPVSLAGVELRDDRGESLAYLPKVEIGPSLWKLLAHRTVDSVRVVEPELNIHLTDDGFDLLYAIEPLWADARGETAPGAIDVEVREGSIHVTDDESRQSWQIASLSGACHLPSSRRQPMEITGAGEIHPGRMEEERDDEGHVVSKFKRLWAGGGGERPVDRGSGKFSFECTVPREFDDTEEQSGAARLEVDGAPLALANLIVRQYSPGADLSGDLSAQMEYQWESGPNGSAQQLAGQMTTTDLLVTAPWLNDDVLKLGKLTMPCRMRWRDDELQVEQLSASCDLGELNYEGNLNTQLGIIHSLERRPWELRGNVDLAKLAASLPNTIHVREGTKITAGNVQLELASLEDSGQMVWRGQMETSHIAAETDGRHYSWDNPVHVTFDAHDTPAGRVVDQLTCKSRFLEIEAAGSREEMKASAAFNLHALAEELDQFLDLRDVELAGDGWSHLNWKQNESGDFRVDGDLQVRNLRLNRPDHRPWNEDNLVMFLEATGRIEDSQLAQLEEAKLKIDGGEERLNRDELVAWLLKPVSAIENDTRYPIGLKARGQLARWLARLEPWTGDLISGDVDGSFVTSAQGAFSTQAGQFDQIETEIRGLVGRMGPVQWDEPELTASGSGRWDRHERELSLDRVALRCETINIDGRQVEARLPAEGTPSVRGDLSFNGELGRLLDWLRDPEAEPSTTRTHGKVSGKAQIARDGQLTTTDVTARIDDLVVESPDQDPYREREVRLALRGAYDADQDRLKLDALDVTSGALAVKASGQINELAERKLCDLSGHVEYDASEIARMLENYLGRGLSATGRESQAFVLRGPLAEAEIVARRGVSREEARRQAEQQHWRDLTGEAALGWQSIDAYGFVAGPGQLHGRLRDGVLWIDPLDVALSGGRLHASPQVRLTPAPMVLTVERGAGLDRVQITEEMCTNWLQFAAPVMAGATRAEGSFSLALDGFQAPVSALKTADIAGRLTIHQVEIGPGPLVEELAVLLERPAPAKIKRESQVDLRMVGGRIYHRNLEMEFPDFTIRTHGYVALDRTLAILAEMPVPRKWIGDNRLGSAIKDQTIQLPIGGTLDRPQIDQQQMARLTAQFVRDAAGRAVVNELNDQVKRQFDRLLNLPK